MAGLFRVSTEYVSQQSCKLRLYIIHPDQEYFYADTVFALRVLWERADEIGEAPLTQEMTYEQVFDDDWAWANSERYVAEVDYLESRNYPRSVNFTEMTEAEFEAYWQDDESLPQALLIISVTEPRWLQHVQIGDRWEATAYS